MDYQFDQIYDWVTIESNVFHQFKVHLHRLSCMNILYSLRKRGGLEINFEIGRPQQVSLRLLYCDVDVLTVTDENHKRCILPILPLNVPRSYTLLC